MWFPGAGFKHQAQKWRVPILAALNVPFDEYQRRRVRCKPFPIIHSLLMNSQKLGEERFCIAATLLDEMASHGETEAPFNEEDVRGVLATIHAGTVQQHLRISIVADHAHFTAGSDTVCYRPGMF